MTEVLLCGGTGDLGGRIAARLADHGIPFRALVRASSDTARLRPLAADLRVGDLADRTSVDRAMDGMRTVITTANGITRGLAGDASSSIDDVDLRGNENLVRAAEAAGVDRFVFVSVTGLTDLMVRLAPFMAAKLRTDQLLRASTMRSVIVRPAPFQDLWLSPATGIRPDKRLAVVFGRGRSPSNDVAADDVAEACVRLATMDDPPEQIELGGPEALTRQAVIDAFERAYGVRFRRISVPRPVLRLGAAALRRRRPALASVLGMALARDLQGEQVATAPLLQLGIEPRRTSDRIEAMAREAHASQAT